MGILSDAIQARNPASHTICEFHPDIIPRMRAWAEGKSNITLHEDKWITVDNGRYDAILMDTYADDDLHYRFREFCNRKISKSGGKISWWNFNGGETDEYMRFYWKDGITFTDVAVDPPTNSYYNLSVYKVPIKTLTPKATGFGILNSSSISLSDGSGKNIDKIHSDSTITCENPANPSLVNKDPVRSMSMTCKGVYTINDGLLVATGNHIMIIERDGSWVEKKMNEVIVGDKLYKIDNTKVEITKIDFNDSETKHTVSRLLINYNYFANGILIKQGGTDG